jgi:hypothetical protein
MRENILDPKVINCAISNEDNNQINIYFFKDKNQKSKLSLSS